jgi:hypothetical protein
MTYTVTIDCSVTIINYLGEISEVTERWGLPVTDVWCPDSTVLHSGCFSSNPEVGESKLHPDSDISR